MQAPLLPRALMPCEANSTTWCPGPKAKWLERKAAAVAAVRVQEPDAGLCTMLAAACGNSVTTLRDGMVRGWLTPVQADVDHLRQSAVVVEGGNLVERQRAFETRATTLRGEARGIAARSNELGKSTATEMRALAGAVAIPPNQAGFSCYDPTLAERLKQAALQAELPAKLTLRDATFNEGPAGVANAVKKLWTNIGSYLSGALTYVFSAGRVTIEGNSGGPITGRDLIALLATIGIDLGLLALAALKSTSGGAWAARWLGRISRPPAAAEPTVIRQLASA